MKSASIWYNYWNPPYQSGLPAFFDSKDFEWAKALRDNRVQLIEEVLRILAERDGQLMGYFSEAVSTDEQKWHTLGIKTWNIDVTNNLKKTTFISDWLKRYPQVVSASVNILNAGGEIAKHQGDTDAIYRCHFGIEIPASLPEAGFSVKGESRSWVEGDSLIFLDANTHRAWNKSSGRRVVFLYDVLRPEYESKKTSVCINVRAFLLLQYFANKWKWLKKGSKRLHRFVFWNIRLGLYIIYPIQKRTGVLLKHS